MRILHTADWHVGKLLRGRSRAEEHEAVLRETVSIAAETKVDLAIVSGDLFDSAAPTPEAERIVYRALLELARVVSHVIVIAGNHDNPRRLEAIEPLLELTNIHCLARVARPEDGGVLTLHTERGEAACVALFPFLSQRDIVRADELMCQDAADHATAYAERTGRVVDRLCRGLPGDSVNLLVGHVMVHGGVLGGGERSAHTVFEYSIPTTSFAGNLHYVALGHLHRVQQLSAACPVWYSGSPLQLDFGESEDRKSVNIVDAHPGRPARVEVMELQSGRRLRRVAGTIDELKQRSDDFGDDFLRIEIDAAPAPGLADEVRELFPNAVDVRTCRPLELRQPAPRSESESPQELFGAYLDERGARHEDLESLFAELLEELHASDPS